MKIAALLLVAAVASPSGSAGGDGRQPDTVNLDALPEPVKAICVAEGGCTLVTQKALEAALEAAFLEGAKQRCKGDRT